MASDMVSGGNASTSKKLIKKLDTKSHLYKTSETVLKSIRYRAYLMELPFWSDRKKLILNFFWNACTDAKLPLKWRQQQILETLLLLDKLHFTLGVLKKQWLQIKKISQTMDYCLSDIECNLYDVILAHCKPLKDDKLPVSRELLAALCNMAPSVLQTV